MKIATTLVAAAAMAASSALPSTAIAQRGQSLGQMHTTIKSRINMGLRNGSLTRNEASRLRTRFANIRRIEMRYARNGFTYGERADLNRRYSALSSSIRYQRHDMQRRGYRR